MKLGRRIFIFVLVLISLTFPIVLISILLAVSNEIGFDPEYKKYYTIGIIVDVILAIVLVILALITFLGHKSSMALLIAYFILCCISAIGLPIAYLVLKSDIVQTLRGWWEYNKNSRGLDYIQNHLNCCGFYNSSDMRSNKCNKQLDGCFPIVQNKARIGVPIWITLSFLFALVLIIAIVLMILMMRKPVKLLSVNTP